MGLPQDVHQAEDSITVSYRRISQELQPGHFDVRMRLVLNQRQIEWEMDMPVNTSVFLTLDEGQRLRLLATPDEFLIDSSGLARSIALRVYEEGVE